MRALVVVVIALGGCSSFSSTGEVPDPGPGGASDAGTSEHMDAGEMGREDSGPPGEEDAGTPPGDPDTGPPVEPDAGPPRRDAGPPAPVRMIHCRDMTCTGMQACCATDFESHCIDSPRSDCRCDGVFCDDTVVACDGPTDCPAMQICCASAGPGSDTADTFSCQATCTGDGVTRRSEVCQDGDSIGCRNGRSCGDVFWFPDGYRGCGS
jgi:hypothetical protein